MRKIRHVFFFMLVTSLLSAQVDFDPNRNYSLETLSTGRFLRVKSGSNATVEYDGSNSSWKLQLLYNNVYKIKAAGTNKVLRATSTSSNIILADELGVAREHWQVIGYTSGYFRIKNVGTNLYATAKNEQGASNSNPDVKYANDYSKVGLCTQEPFQSAGRQLWHIAPIKYSNQQALAVPQLGWLPDRSKRAILVRNSDIAPPSYVLKRVSDSIIVASGTFQKWDGSNKTMNQYYYTADINYSTPGNYILESDNKSVSVLIADDIYQNPRSSKNGTVSLTDVFDGFWKYNRFYPNPNTIKKTNLVRNNGTNTFPGLSSGQTYTVSPFGWFDAHSRDAKMGRSAKAVADLCYAYMESTNAADRSVLAQQIEYGTQHLFDNQLPDGSWEAGRIRAAGGSTEYYWVTNIDVNTVARCVKALALVNQVFSSSNPTLASNALSSAQLGWTFVSSNENLIDPHLNFSYKGDAADLLAAAIEMAYATNDSQFFTKADQLIMDATYAQGIFKKINGSFPGQLNNSYHELDNGTIISICRYLNIATNSSVISKTNLLLNDFIAHWENINGGVVSPYGFNQHVIDRASGFGNLVNVARLSYAMMAIWNHTQNQTALDYAESGFQVLTGLNPFQTSYIVGYGDSAIPQSVNYFKRSFKDGIGSILPGWNTDGQNLVQSRTRYHNTEGVLPTSSTLFYLLASLHNLGNTNTNSDCSLLDGTNVVSTNSNCVSSDDGSITFSFSDAPNRSMISLSIDGGANYTTVSDNSQTYTFNNLSSGSYDTFVRWGDGTCERNIGSVSVECNEVVFLSNKQYANLNLRATNSSGGLNLQNLDDFQEQWMIVPAEGEWFYLENLGFNNERLRAVNSSGTFDLVNKVTSTGFHVQWREISVPSDPGYFYLENRFFSERLKALGPNTFDLTLDVGPRVRWIKSSVASNTTSLVFDQKNIFNRESDVNDVIIYIDPTDKNTLRIVGLKGNTKVSIYNMFGQLLKTDQAGNQVDISGIGNGIYICLFDNQEKGIKFIKE